MKENFQILYVDSNILAINKPAGLLSIPDRYDISKINAFEMVKVAFPNAFVVHRLDKDTSGVLCFALNENTHREINICFEKGEIQKEYLAISNGHPPYEEGVIDLPIAHSTIKAGSMIIHPKGKPSLTKYRLIEKFSNFSYILLRPETGRTHQIRVHLASIGCPIVADPLYNQNGFLYIDQIKNWAHRYDADNKIPLMARTALHASQIKIPFQNKEIVIDCEPPKDFKASLNQLKRWSKI